MRKQKEEKEEGKNGLIFSFRGEKDFRDFWNLINWLDFFFSSSHDAVTFFWGFVWTHDSIFLILFLSLFQKKESVLGLVSFVSLSLSSLTTRAFVRRNPCRRQKKTTTTRTTRTTTNTTNNGIPSDFRLGVSSRRPPERHFQRLRLVRAPQRQRGTSDRHVIRPLRPQNEQIGSDEFVRGSTQRATINRAGFIGRGIPPSDD